MDQKKSENVYKQSKNFAMIIRDKKDANCFTKWQFISKLFTCSLHMQVIKQTQTAKSCLISNLSHYGKKKQINQENYHHLLCRFSRRKRCVCLVKFIQLNELKFIFKV